MPFAVLRNGSAMGNNGLVFRNRSDVAGGEPERMRFRASHARLLDVSCCSHTRVYNWRVEERNADGRRGVSTCKRKYGKRARVVVYVGLPPPVRARLHNAFTTPICVKRKKCPKLFVYTPLNRTVSIKRRAQSNICNCTKSFFFFFLLSYIFCVRRRPV